MTEDDMVGWYQRLNGHKSEQTLGESEGQGSLVCCSPCGCRELDLVTEQQQLVFGEFALRLFLHPSPALLCNVGVCVCVCVCMCVCVRVCVCVGSGDGLIPAGCTSHLPCQLGFS